jgi:hypothetical protein
LRPNCLPSFPITCCPFTHCCPVTGWLCLGLFTMGPSGDWTTWLVETSLAPLSALLASPFLFLMLVTRSEGDGERMSDVELGRASSCADLSAPLTALRVRTEDQRLRLLSCRVHCALSAASWPCCSCASRWRPGMMVDTERK